MADGSVKIVVASVVLAVGAGVGTAWFMVPRMEPPGGPAVSGPDLRLEAENRKLKEEVRSLQRQVAEARLEAAARKAFPRGGPGAASPEDPEAARLLRDADEIRLRTAMDRAAGSVAIEKDRREEVVRLLLDASGRMRTIQARIASAPAGDHSASAEAEDLGREVRRKLQESLTPEQLKAVDLALGAPPPDEGGPEDGGKR